MLGEPIGQARGPPLVSPTVYQRSAGKEQLPCDNGSTMEIASPSPARSRRASLSNARVRFRNLQCFAIGSLVALAVVFFTQHIGSQIGEPSSSQQGVDESNFQGSLREVTEGTSGEHLEVETSHLAQSDTCHNKTKAEFPTRVQEWAQQKFKLHKELGFMQFSAYRMEANKFAILGMQDAFAIEDSPTRRPPSSGTCKWHEGKERVVNGVLSFHYGGETHDKQYEVLVIHCTLQEDTEACGGYLLGVINGVEFVLFREDTDRDHPLAPSPPFASQLTYCSPPLYSELNPMAVRNWMDYHRVIFGFGHFVFYDTGAISEAVRKELGHYLREGVLEVVQFREATLQRGDRAWAFAQGLAGNDCLYRSRFTSKWILSANPDDYLEIAAPGVTFQGLLRQYAHLPWMTVGAIIRATDHCRPAVIPNGMANGNGSRSADSAEPKKLHSFVERMVFRATEAYCIDRELYPDPNVCLLHFGHRTYFANPRLTTLLQLHMVLDPFLGGVDLDAATQLRKSCFPGLALRRSEGGHCTLEVAPGAAAPPHLQLDTGVADRMPVAWACPIGHESCAVQLDR